MKGKQMKIFKTILPVLFVMALLSSCKKDHYDVGNVHGVNAEGEILAPVASASFSLRDMMERFELMDVVQWDSEGDMALHYGLEMDSVLTGSEMLRFKDLDYEEHFAYPNPYQNTPPPYTDTVLSFARAITFESEHVFVMEGQVKSGRLDFEVNSNAGRVRRVVLRSPNIKDAAGNDFEMDIPVHGNTFGFDLTGLSYIADEPNSLEISYEISVRAQTIHDEELYLDVAITGRDLAFSEMRGFVEEYSSRNREDTVFTMFPDELHGMLEIEGVRLKISERNTFDLGARFVVDTLTFESDNIPAHSIFDPMPMTVELPHALQYTPVFDSPFTATVSAAGGRFFASSDFIVNQAGVTEMVTISDTCRIGVRADLEIPFSFTADDITYLDTVNMDVANLEMPDLIEKLTLEMTFTSTLPVGLDASFFMYDSEREIVTDTLLTSATLIKASFDGQPATTEVTLEIDEDRIGNVLRSDRIIMSYLLDSEGHDVDLNVNQKLDLALKARAKYKGVVEFENTGNE